MLDIIRLRNHLEDRLISAYSRFLGRSFRHYVRGWIHPSTRFDNPQYISLDKVCIGKGCWIYAMIEDTAGHTYEPEIVIGRRTAIGNYCHIVCATKLTIGQHVLMGQSIFISDSTHVYLDPAIPISDQGLTSAPISIGEGTWIGNNAAILGCSVGRNCVIGANAVVNRDVPDNCVAVGTPARIVKRYDPEKGLWVRCQ